MGIKDENGDVHEMDPYEAVGNPNAVIRLRLGVSDGFRLDIPLDQLASHRNYRKNF